LQVLDREKYVVVVEAADRDLGAICAAVFEAYDATAVTVRVDAYSDHSDQMPADIRTAELWLRERGLRHVDGDPGVAIAIDRTDEVGWAIARAYAPWSIRISLQDADAISLATIEDGGALVTVSLLPDEIAALTDSLGGSASLVRFTEWTATTGSD
jgi:hypothetical protein